MQVMRNQEKTEMTHKFRWALLAALGLAGAGMVGSASQSLAQIAPDFSGIATDISAQKDQGKKEKAGPRQASPRNIGQRNIGQRNIGQRNIGQRNIRQRNIGQS